MGTKVICDCTKCLGASPGGKLVDTSTRSRHKRLAVGTTNVMQPLTGSSVTGAARPLKRQKRAHVDIPVFPPVPLPSAVQDAANTTNSEIHGGIDPNDTVIEAGGSATGENPDGPELLGVEERKLEMA